MSDIKIDVTTHGDDESKWITIPNPDVTLPPKEPKRRKFGIRFKKQVAKEWGWTVPTRDGAELYDIETGEAFEGVISLNVEFNTTQPLQQERKSQITAMVELFVAAVDSYERSE